MAGAKQSKTARASVKAGVGSGAGGYSSLGEINRVVPLNGGKGVYLFHPLTGKTMRFPMDSPDLVATLAECSNKGHGAKLLADFQSACAKYPALDWAPAIEKLQAAGAFGA